MVLAKEIKMIYHISERRITWEALYLTLAVTSEIHSKTLLELEQKQNKPSMTTNDILPGNIKIEIKMVSYGYTGNDIHNKQCI